MIVEELFQAEQTKRKLNITVPLRARVCVVCVCVCVCVWGGGGGGGGGGLHRCDRRIHAESVSMSWRHHNMTVGIVYTHGENCVNYSVNSLQNKCYHIFDFLLFLDTEMGQVLI